MYRYVHTARYRGVHLPLARRIGTRVPKQNRDRRAEFHVWHPGAIPKGAPAVKNGTGVVNEFLRRISTDVTGPGGGRVMNNVVLSHVYHYDTKILPITT